MVRRIGFAVVVIVSAAATAVLSRRYRHDLAEARRRLSTVERQEISTEFGVIDYAEQGHGPAVLVSHGIFHGCDGGLRSVRDTVVGRRIIAPSRFGYLGSTLPADAGSAMQADAFVALLDHLRLEQVDVVGVSAGTGAAVQLALRHPQRIDHVIISSGNLPGSTTAARPPGWAKLFYSDVAMWTIRTLAPPMLARLMGVPVDFPEDADQAREVDEMVDSIFPLEDRHPGAVFDAFVSNPEANSLPLESVTVPTLIVHAEDDPLAPYDAAVQAAHRIPGSVLVSLESGGHLALGQADRVRSEIARFLGDRDRAPA